MKLRNKKTGEICELVGFKISNDSFKKKFGEKDYYSLQDFCSEWEDYESKEPLIKDEKIRKAVKAWAEVNDIKKIIVFDCGNNAPYTPVGAVDFAENGSHLEIRFRTEERFDTDRIYTIEELCGEEKG